MATYTKISPKKVKPSDVAGNAEEDFRPSVTKPAKYIQAACLAGEESYVWTYLS